MKDYRKLMKTILKDSNFKLEKSGRKTTVKLVYTPTNEMYSIHPGDNAISPLKKWVKKLKNKKL